MVYMKNKNKNVQLLFIFHKVKLVINHFECMWKEVGVVGSRIVLDTGKGVLKKKNKRLGTSGLNC